jgi:hypothetical protein
MNPCGATRVLIPGFMVGVAVSTFTGNDLLAWVAAAVTITVVAVIQRIRGATTSCAIPASTEAHRRAADLPDAEAPAPLPIRLEDSERAPRRSDCADRE